MNTINGSLSFARVSEVSEIAGKVAWLFNVGGEGIEISLTRVGSNLCLEELVAEIPDN